MQSPSQDSRFHRIYEEHRSAVMAYCNSVTFSQRFFPSNGGCVGISGHEVTVEDGKIAHYDWGPVDEPCE